MLQFMESARTSLKIYPQVTSISFQFVCWVCLFFFFPIMQLQNVRYTLLLHLLFPEKNVSYTGKYGSNLDSMIKRNEIGLYMVKLDSRLMVQYRK